MATLTREKKRCRSEIDAKKAMAEGIKFYIGNDKVWLCDKMPAKYIKIFKK